MASCSGRWNVERVIWLWRRKWSRFPSARTALDFTWRGLKGGSPETWESITERRCASFMHVTLSHRFTCFLFPSFVPWSHPFWNYFTEEQNVARVNKSECLCLALVCKSVNALTLSLSADARVAACNILSSSMSDNSSWKSTPTLTLIKTQQVKRNKIKSPTTRALSEG